MRSYHPFALSYFLVLLVGCASGGTEPTFIFFDGGGPQMMQPMPIRPDVDIPDGLRGQPCDPLAETGACATFCAPLGRGSTDGECAETCSGPGDPMCRPPYFCNTLIQAGEARYFCLPNRACGGLDYYGYCDGDTLFHCGYAGQERTRCEEQGKVCGQISFELGYDCISGNFTGGCGDVPTRGQCDGDTLSYCESLESGTVKTTDCSRSGQVCQTQDGRAGCVAPGGTGCGTIPSSGVCEGNVVVRCDMATGNVERTACNPNQVCTQGAGTGTAFCAEERPDPMGNEIVVRGTAFYEKVPLTAGGYGRAILTPIGFAGVIVLDQNAQYVVGTYTDQSGAFSVNVPRGQQRYSLAIVASANNPRHVLSVRDCPLQEDPSGCNIHGISAPEFSADRDVDLGRLVATVDSGKAGAFNIFALGIRVFDFAQEGFGRAPPGLVVAWNQGSNTSCQTSCYSDQLNTVYVLGTQSDTDEFDDGVLLHEYGHFVEAKFSRSDSPGGYHDGSATDPRLAWGEGYGTYFGAELSNDPLYLDGSAGGVSQTQVDNDTTADLNDPRGLRQPVSEYMVMGILWKAARGGRGTAALGRDAVFDSMSNYLGSNQLQDRGVGGVDLVDFLDGLACRGSQIDGLVSAVVRGEHRFPYAVGGPATCR